MSWERAEWHLSLLFSHVAVPGLCEGQQLFLLHYGAAAASTAFAMTILQQATVELDVATMGIYRVVFAALSVCPVMSLLGAKRPQYGVWQFIVGSLAAVLAAGCIRGSYSPGGSSEPSHSWTLFSTRAGYRWLDELCRDAEGGRRDTHCRGAPGADLAAFAGWSLKPPYRRQLAT